MNANVLNINVTSIQATAAALLLACASCSTLARADDPPLKGPKVKDSSVPGESRPFGAERRADRKDRAGAIAHPVFMRAVHALEGDDTPKDLHLTPEQDKRIDEIDAEFRTQMRTYVADHHEEVAQLLRDLPAAERQRASDRLGWGRPADARAKGAAAKGANKGQNKGGAKSSTDDAMVPNETDPSPQASETARQRLRELRDGAPQPAEAHAKIFGVLTAPQKAAVEAELKKLEQRRGDAKGRPAKNPDKSDDKADDRDGKGRLSDAMRERLKNMTPDERRAAIKKWRDERRDDKADTNDKGEKGEKGDKGKKDDE